MRAISGTYDNENHFASLMTMVLPLPVCLALVLLARHRGSRSSRAAAITTLGLLFLATGMLVAVGLSLSKMGVVSMLVALAAVAFIGVASRVRGWRRVPASAIVVMLAIAMLFLFLPNDLVRNFGVVSSDRPSAGRVPIWMDGVRLFAAYPAFGSGLNTFFPGLLRYQTADVALGWPAAHNDYLQFLSELGIGGFLIVAVFVSTVFARTVRVATHAADYESRCLAFACVGGLTALLVHCLVEFNLRMPGNAMVFAWIAGTASALPLVSPSRRTTDTNPPGAGQDPMFWTAAVVMMCAMASLVYFVYLRHNPDIEQALCRVGICDDIGGTQALTTRNKVDALGAVPPDQLLPYLARDPANPYRWSDVAESLQNDGRTAEARFASSRAQILAPRIPAILARAANFHFDLGEHNRGLELMAAALHAWGSEPTYDYIAFAEYDRRGFTDKICLGLPADASIHRLYLRWHIQGDPIPEHNDIWNWILEHQYADDALAREYTEFLMKTTTPEAAWKAWAGYTRRGDGQNYANGSLILNGGFESSPSGVPFDWRMWNVDDDAVPALDDTVARSGRQSLRIRFDGQANVDYSHTSLMTVATPGRTLTGLRPHHRPHDRPGHSIAYLRRGECRPHRRAELIRFWERPTGQRSRNSWKYRATRSSSSFKWCGREAGNSTIESPARRG